MPPHYVLAGVFTQDKLPDGRYMLGGTTYYSGVQVRRLGWEVSIISSAQPDIDLSALEAGTQTYIQPSPASTIFENIYDSQGNRTQYVRAKADPLRLGEVPALKPDILHLAPLGDEVPLDYGKAFSGARIAVTPQGWMRHIGPDGRVSSKRWEDAEKLLPDAWAMVFSEEDVGHEEAEIERLARLCAITVCTRGLSAASLFVNGERSDIPARPSTIVDPTGAGDVFAAAFFVRLFETDDPVQAVQFGHVAAGVSIEGTGVSRVLARDEIMRQWQSLPKS